MSDTNDPKSQRSSRRDDPDEISAVRAGAEQTTGASQEAEELAEKDFDQGPNGSVRSRQNERHSHSKAGSRSSKKKAKTSFAQEKVQADKELSEQVEDPFDKVPEHSEEKNVVGRRRNSAQPKTRVQSVEGAEHVSENDDKFAEIIEGQDLSVVHTSESGLSDSVSPPPVENSATTLPPVGSTYSSRQSRRQRRRADIIQKVDTDNSDDSRSARRAARKKQSRTSNIDSETSDKGSKPNSSSVAAKAGNMLFAVTIVAVITVVVYSGTFIFKHFAHTYEISAAPIAAQESLSVCPALPQMPTSGTGVDSEFETSNTQGAAAVQGVVSYSEGNTEQRAQLQNLKGKNLGNFTSGDRDTSPYLQVDSDKKVSDVSKVRAPALENSKVNLSANFTYMSDSEDLKGLASASCQPTSSEMWLTGISTALGDTSVLTIVNPGKGSANISIELFDDKGKVKSIPLDNFSLKGQSRRSLNVASLAPNKQRITAKLTSSGSAVSATVSQMKTRGLDSGGVEVMTPNSGPSTAPVITGYSMPKAEVVKSIISQEGYEDARPILQITAPDLEAEVNIKVYDESGQVAFEDESVRVKEGQVSDVLLDSLPAGKYSIALDSNVNILAAAKMISGNSSSSQEIDFSWAQATAALDTQNLSAVAKGPQTELFLVSPKNDSTVKITPVNADASWGKEIEVSLAKGKTKVVDTKSLVTGNKEVIGYVLRSPGNNPVYASQYMSSGQGSFISWTGILKPSEKQNGVPVAMHY